MTATPTAITPEPLRSAGNPPPDTAKDAARKLHEALELTVWHLSACYAPADTATKQILDEDRALLEATREAAGRMDAPR